MRLRIVFGKAATLTVIAIASVCFAQTTNSKTPTPLEKRMATIDASPSISCAAAYIRIAGFSRN
jgi:hypothetical protein